MISISEVFPYLETSRATGDNTFTKSFSTQVDTSLEILEVRPDDAGTYLCNVETYGEPLDQEHTLDVLVPPSVQVGPSF